MEINKMVMEHIKTDSCLKNKINKLINPIFDKALKETTKNRMTVGLLGSSSNPSSGSFVYFQPHNLRHFFDFDKCGFSLLDPRCQGSGVVPKLINNQREVFFKDFFGCNITVKKSQICVKNNVDFKKWHKISLSKESHLELHAAKVHESTVVLKKFIEFYGGSSKFDILNISSEDKFMNEDFIDVLPLKARWHDEVSKKVYNDRSLELSPALASNYISNQASLKEPFCIVKWCEVNLVSFDSVFSFESVIVNMSFDNRVFVSNFLFSRFGGS